MLGVALLLIVSLHCAYAQESYVDLTHVFDEKSSRFPTRIPVKRSTLVDGEAGVIGWIRAYDITMPDQIGTSMDAPAHMYRWGSTIDKVPFQQLHGPAVVIDIREKAAKDKDATVTKNDLMHWERKYGRIPFGAYVLVYSGWDEYWNDQLKYVGSYNDTEKVRFPGFSDEAAEWLVKNRNINAVGVDTISCDYGQTKTYGVHQTLFKYNKLCIENIANLGKLSQSGFEVFAMPPKLGRASAITIRMYGVKRARHDVVITAGGSAVTMKIALILPVMVALSAWL